ncbi:MAG TPA: Fe-S cluster assembly protein SufD [Bacteroidia bacterium]|nr:Fe-S cluster assembly protein SufD [Bacteroidia bacterium]
MSNTLEKMNVSDFLVSAIEQNKNNTPVTAHIQDLQKLALAEFSRQEGLPHRKNEEYKYSPVASLFKTELTIGGVTDTKKNNQELEKLGIPGLDANLITLINGELQEDQLSAGKKQSFQVQNLKSLVSKPSALFTEHFGKYALPASDPFIALNTAAFRDVLFITIPDQMVLDKPILILNITDVSAPSLISPRILIHAGRNASAEIIEMFASTGSGEAVFTNSLSEIVVEEQARVLFYKIQDRCEKLNLLSTTQVIQGAKSHFDTHTVTLSGDWVRNNLNIVPDAQYCETHLNGLFILKGNQHTDNHTLVDHRKPNCESNQLYRGILDGKSSGVFNGKIFVRPDAQKTNAYQSSKNMLLSDGASINTKPQLEIYADDVKCSHGSSTGQIDENALFYLRARGIGTESARALLLIAFAKDVINTIRIDALRLHVESLIEERLTK